MFLELKIALINLLAEGRKIQLEKMKVLSRRHYLKNKESILKRGRERKAANPEKTKADAKRYRDSHKTEIAEYHRLRHLKNPEESRKRGREWYSQNREKKLSKNKEWRLNNIERFKAAGRQWEKNNPEKMRAKRRRRYSKNKTELNKIRSAAAKVQYHSDPLFRIKLAMYRFLNKGLQGKRPDARCQEMIGCTFQELKVHLESQFKEGMTWQNYGRHGWHVDHRKPFAAHDLSDPIQLKACLNWRNLQPLWEFDNLSKGSKLLPEFLPTNLVANSSFSN